MFNFKKATLSLVAIAGLSSVAAVAADTTATMTAVKKALVPVVDQLVTEAGSTTAESLLQKQIGGIATKAEAGMAMNAAGAIADLLRKDASAAAKFKPNSEAISKAVAASPVRPSVAAEVILEGLKNGIYAPTYYQTELNNKALDQANLVPSMINANVKASEFLATYRAVTPEFKALLAQGGLSDELQKNVVSMLVASLKLSAETAEARGENADEVASLLRQVVELAVATYKETLSWAFLGDIIKGFPQEQSADGLVIALTDYARGGVAYLQTIRADFAAALKTKAPAAAAASSFAISLDTASAETVSVPQSTAQGDSCFKTGQSGNGAGCTNGMCSTVVPAGMAM